MAFLLSAVAAAVFSLLRMMQLVIATALAELPVNTTPYPTVLAAVAHLLFSNKQ